MSAFFHNPEERPWWLRYAFAVVLVGLGWLLRWSLGPVLVQGTPLAYGAFMPAILLAALFGGIGPGLFALFLSVLVGNYFFATGGTSIFLTEAKDIQSFASFSVIGLCIAIAAGSQRQSTIRARRSAREATNSQLAQQESEKIATKRLAELEILYDLSPVGLAFLDTNMRFVRINGLLAKLDGWTPDQLVGRSLEETLEEDYSKIEPLFTTVMKSRQPLRDVEIPWKVPTGEIRYLMAQFDPVIDQQGQLLGVNVVVVDQTERKLGDIKTTLLSEATRMFTSSLDYENTLTKLAEATVPNFADWCSIDVLDGDLIRNLAIKHVDPVKASYARELETKIPSRADSNTRVAAVIRNGISELHKEIPHELMKQSAASEEELRFMEESDLRSCMIVPLVARGNTFGALTLVWAESKRQYDEDDLAVAEELGRRAGIAIDNSRLYQEAQHELQEKKRAEAEVRELNSELEKRVESRTSELRAAMDELEGFCYSVSHDLRAPMRSLSGNSRMLLEDFGTQLNEEGKDHLRRISMAASKMGELVDDLLQFSRLGRTHLSFRMVDLSELAEASITAYKSQNPESNAMAIIQPGLRACGDPNVLALAIQNLIDNALKYSSKVSNPKLEFGVQVKGEEKIYFVKDNGVGFDMKYAPKIFEPFQRLHRDAEYPGTGIGLANVKRVIARHGGHIWVEAAPGVGATFYFTLCARCNEESSPMSSAAPPYLG